MGINQIPAAVGRTRYLTTLTSGTSYTVPTGVTYLNVTLRGGGGGGSGAGAGLKASGGQIVSSTLSVTSGASITYAIGAGGTAGTSTPTSGGQGGTTTFTGATSAVGGAGGSINIAVARAGTSYMSAENGGWGSGATSTGAGAVGGDGSIDVEYWL